MALWRAFAITESSHTGVERRPQGVPSATVVEFSASGVSDGASGVSKLMPRNSVSASYN
jgi:hypothetical protein